MENDKRIFNYLNPYSNDNLSSLKISDLNNIVKYINYYYLELRYNLGISINDTFGVEIECEEADEVEIKRKIQFHNLNHWNIEDDISLFKGCEVTSPILIDSIDTWKELSIICGVVKNNAVIGNSTAGHIHIGSQVLGNKAYSWLNLFKIWSTYENIIFRFLYNEFLNARPSISQYALPISKKILLNYDYIEAMCKNNFKLVIKNIFYDKNNSVNFQNVKNGNFSRNNTIEFRCPNGTFNSIVWQNNINLLVKILNYCKSKKFNDEIINSRMKLIDKNNMDLEWYHNIYIEEAIEFCDLIFDNNLDKIYFLRQYFKSFEISKKSIGVEESKCFCKNIYN